jgi:hypothetical protein
MTIGDDIKLSSFSQAVKDLARPNRFLVSIIRSIGQQPFEDIKYFVNKATIPSVDIIGPEIQYFGTKITLAGDPKFQPLTISFLNGTNKNNDWSTRDYFETWLSSIVTYDYNTNQHASGKLDYRKGATISVKQLSSGDKVIANYEYFNAVPLSISEISLDMASNNQTETFDVVFYYTYFNRGSL